MTEPETRYRKTKRIEGQKERHAEIVGKLLHGTGVVEQFEAAVEEYKPPCVTGEFPSPHTDWSSGPDPEVTESERPTREEAKAMCVGCRIGELCEEWAIATGKTHGVYNGRIVENGVWDTYE